MSLASRIRRLSDWEKTPSSLNFIKDKSGTDSPNEEFFKFVRFSRGTQSRLVATNQDMFIIWGQNGAFASLMVGSYILVWILGLGKSQNKILRLVVFLQRQLIVMFFVKLQFIALIELGVHDIQRQRDPRFIFSYILSWAVVSITVVELLRAYSFVKEGHSDYEKLSKADLEKAQIWNFWSKDLETTEKSKGNVHMVMSSARWTLF